MDWTTIGTGIAIITFTYTYLRNIRIDLKSDIRKMEQRLNQQDERIFLLATGKTIQEALLEEKRKRKR